MYEDNKVEVIINTGNKLILYDHDDGVKIFDLQVFNKTVGKSDILLYFSSKIRSMNPNFVKGFCEYWISNHGKQWIMQCVHVHPLRLEEQFYAGLV